VTAVEKWQLAFVDSITASPAVRLDVHQGTRGPWNLRDASRFDPPPLRRAIPQSLMGDGGIPTSAAYDNRTIFLKLQLLSGGVQTAADPGAAQMQLLMRELDRPSNILRLQAGTSAPVFFRTYRSGPDAIDWDPVNREATISLLAEPFAYGIEETLSAVTVYNDPVEGTTLNPNPYFETDVSGWVATGGTFVRSTAQFHEGAASGLLTPNGVSGTAQTETNPHLTGATPATAYRASVWVRCAASRNVEVRIDYYTAADGFISNTIQSSAVTLNTWTLIQAGGTSPALTGRIGLTVAMTGTPPAGNTLHIDEARIRRAGDLGGMCFDVASPKGDVETPLHLQIASGGVVATGRRRTMLAVRRRGTPSALPIVLQAEDMTQGAVTTTQPNSALMSGPAGNNFSRTTFVASTSMTQRLSGTFPPSASIDARGTYRVLARVRQNTSTDVIDVRLRWGGIDVQRTGTTVRLPADTGPSTPTIKYVELDVIQVPVDYDPVYRGPSGVEIAAEGLFVAFDAQRVSGAGSLDVDLLLFVPADDTLEMITWPAAAGGPTVVDYMAVGGTSPAAYGRGAAGQVISTEAVEIAGQGLMVSPGRTNRIFVARDTGTGTAITGAGDDIAGSITVTPSYFPRYLSPVRPVSS
jgi:hypothetical protein